MFNFRLLICSLFALLLANVAGAETYDTQAAQTADANRTAAIQKAKEAYKQAIQKADQEAIIKFKQSLDIAAKAKNANDIVKIEAEIKTLQNEIASLSNDAIHVVVVANKENQQIMKVTKGITYHIIANGKWRYIPTMPSCGPDGSVYVGRDFGFLEAKIGNGEYNRIGSDGKIIAEDDGFMYMQMHDDPSGFYDNSGSVQVTIKIVPDDVATPVPAAPPVVRD